jgi:cytochrome b561
MMSPDMQTSTPEPRRWRDGAERYGVLSRINHWVLAALMIAMLGSGLALEYVPLAQAVSGLLRDWHKALGVIVLGLGLWRVGWRLVQGFPQGTRAGPAWQARAAKVMHWALLAAIVVMPLSGLLMTLFAGRSIAVAGFTIPAAPQVDWLAQAAESVHALGGLTLTVLVVGHVLAALKHQLFDRDDTLGRMLPGQRHPRTAEASEALDTRAEALRT